MATQKSIKSRKQLPAPEDGPLAIISHDVEEAPTPYKPKIDYLAHASPRMIQEYELSHMNHAANHERSAIEAMREAVFHAAQALHARWVRDHTDELRSFAARPPRFVRHNQHALDEARTAIAGDSVVFEPFFQPRDVSKLIRRNLKAPQRFRWKRYYQCHGCVRCKDKRRAYGGCGMCSSCYWLVRNQLATVDSWLLANPPGGKSLPEN